MHILSISNKSVNVQIAKRKKKKRGGDGYAQTLYQCFLTLPSVLVGKVWFVLAIRIQLEDRCKAPTLAISLQVLPASRMVFSLCSSSAVQGVLVLPFFLTPASGVTLRAAWLASASRLEDIDGGPMEVIGPCCWMEARLFLGLTGETDCGGGGGRAWGWGCCCCCCCCCG